MFQKDDAAAGVHREGGYRSHLNFNDVSNIQLKLDSTDNTALQSKIEASQNVSPAPKKVRTAMDAHNNYLPSVSRGQVTSNADVSDITDQSALRNNYLEKSANDMTEKSLSQNKQPQTRADQLRAQL